MDFEVFRRAVDECAEWQPRLPYAVKIFPAFRGESLIYRQFQEALNYAKQKGLYVSLTTNATTLDEGMARRILASGIDQITVSIDGLSADDMADIRINSEKFDIIGNLETLLRLRSSSVGNDTTIGVCLVQVPENRHVVQEFVDTWLPAVDVVMIQATYVWDRDEDAKTASDRFGGLPEEDRQACPAIFGINIEYDGNAWVCVASHGREEMNLGPLEDSTIHRLFNHERAKSIRDDFCHGRVPANGPCTACELWKSHYPIDQSTTEHYTRCVTPTVTSFTPLRS